MIRGYEQGIVGFRLQEGGILLITTKGLLILDKDELNEFAEKELENLKINSRVKEGFRSKCDNLIFSMRKISTPGNLVFEFNDGLLTIKNNWLYIEWFPNTDEEDFEKRMIFKSAVDFSNILIKKYTGDNYYMDKRELANALENPEFLEEPNSTCSIYHNCIAGHIGGQHLIILTKDNKMCIATKNGIQIYAPEEYKTKVANIDANNCSSIEKSILELVKVQHLNCFVVAEDSCDEKLHFYTKKSEVSPFCKTKCCSSQLNNCIHRELEVIITKNKLEIDKLGGKCEWMQGKGEIFFRFTSLLRIQEYFMPKSRGNNLIIDTPDLFPKITSEF